jgi:drug/metabolite transporter (DMT)-like permease
MAVPFFWGSMIPTISSVFVDPTYIAISVVNLIHVYTSYKGFQYLNTGISISVFYTYPLFQVIFSAITNGTTITPELVFYLVSSIAGVGILNWREFQGQNKDIWRGLGFILVAAITEAVINIFYKHKNLANPFVSLFSLYFHGTLVFIAYYLWKRYSGHSDATVETLSPSPNVNENVAESIEHIIPNSRETLIKVIIFNILIGAIGYTLRLHSLTLISTEWFSALTFTSAVAAFLFGWVFFSEKIQWNHILGSAIIFYNIFQVKKFIGV